MNPLVFHCSPQQPGQITPLSAAINAIFNSPGEAAAILFLIEDSSYMVPLCIRPHGDDIPAINLSPHDGGGTISPASVTRAIEVLSATFGCKRATRHLVIVAAMNPPLGPRGTLARSTAVELLHKKEIRVHMIVRSQSAMDSLTPLYWELVGKGHVYQSFADDSQFEFYLSDFHGAKDKMKGLSADDRVPNSGSRSTTVSSNGSSTYSVDKPSLVYQLQKINGMEKKRRSRTQRDQPVPSKPGQPYKKNYPYPRTNPSTARSTSPDPSGHFPSRRKVSPRISRVKASSSHSDPLPPRTSADEHKPAYPSTISPPRSSSPPSPYYPGAGTSPSPVSKNPTPLRVSLPIPTLTTQSTPDCLSPSSPGYHDFQGYDNEPPGI